MTIYSPDPTAGVVDIPLDRSVVAGDSTYARMVAKPEVRFVFTFGLFNWTIAYVCRNPKELSQGCPNFFDGVPIKHSEGARADHQDQA